MRRIAIDKNALTDTLVKRILVKVIPQLPGLESKAFNPGVTKAILEDLDFNIGFESVYNEVGMVMKSMYQSCKKRASTFAMEKYYVETADMEGSDMQVVVNALIGFEAEEIEGDDNSFEEGVSGDGEQFVEEENIVAKMVADLIKEIANTDSAEVSKIADAIIDLAKTDIETNKEVEMEGELSSEEIDGDGDENPFGSDEESTEGDDKEDGDKDKKKTSEEDETHDDPFATDGNSDGGEFGTDDEGDKGDGSGSGSNPFEDGEDDSEKNSEEKDDSDNPFAEGNESFKDVSEVAYRTFGLERLEVGKTELINPLAGIKTKDLNGYVKFIVGGVYNKDIAEVHKQYGIESTQFNKVKSQYRQLSRTVYSAVIGTALLASMTGSKINTSKVINPHLL